MITQTPRGEAPDLPLRLEEPRLPPSEASPNLYDPDVARCLRIEERELETGALN